MLQKALPIAFVFVENFLGTELCKFLLQYLKLFDNTTDNV